MIFLTLFYCYEKTCRDWNRMTMKILDKIVTTKHILIWDTLRMANTTFLDLNKFYNLFALSVKTQYHFSWNLKNKLLLLHLKKLTFSEKTFCTKIQQIFWTNKNDNNCLMWVRKYFEIWTVIRSIQQTNCCKKWKLSASLRLVLSAN